MRISSLRAIPLFAQLGDDSLRRILELATEFEVEPGHVLVARDQPGAGLFIVESGTVTVDLPEGQVQLGPGDFFGELALLDEDAVRTARVSASSHVEGWAIRRDDFYALIESEPKVALAMLKTLASRMADLLRQ